jgi:hypothetical protein
VHSRAKISVPAHLARWPETILHAKALRDSIDNMKGVDKPKTDSDKMDSFRHKFEATHRADRWPFFALESGAVIVSMRYIGMGAVLFFDFPVLYR